MQTFNQLRGQPSTELVGFPSASLSHCERRGSLFLGSAHTNWYQAALPQPLTAAQPHSWLTGAPWLWFSQMGWRCDPPAQPRSCARGSSLPTLPPCAGRQRVRRASSAQALAASFGLHHFLPKMQEIDFTLFFMVAVCSRKFQGLFRKSNHPNLTTWELLGSELGTMIPSGRKASHGPLLPELVSLMGLGWRILYALFLKNCHWNTEETLFTLPLFQELIEGDQCVLWVAALGAEEHRDMWWRESCLGQTWP